VRNLPPLRLKARWLDGPNCRQDTIWRKFSDMKPLKLPEKTHVGIVLNTYMIELIPVIRIAWRPTQPASSNTRAVSYVVRKRSSPLNRRETYVHNMR
jgi:hypothetical protein